MEDVVGMKIDLKMKTSVTPTAKITWVLNILLYK